MKLCLLTIAAVAQHTLLHHLSMAACLSSCRLCSQAAPCALSSPGQAFRGYQGWPQSEVRSPASVQASEQGSAKANGVDDAFLRHRTSQRFGADLQAQQQQQQQCKGRGGDDDLAPRRPLSDRRAKMDDVRAKQAAGWAA